MQLTFMATIYFIGRKNGEILDFITRNLIKVTSLKKSPTDYLSETKKMFFMGIESN